MEKSNCNLIAEIGATHIGDLERAKMLIDLAVDAGADMIKFQKRDPHVSTPDSLKKAPHPNPHFSYGKTYLDHRLKLEFDLSTHKYLKEYIEEKGAEYSTSVWEIQSARAILELSPAHIKIPSAMNHNKELILYCLDNFETVHISTGMSTLDERHDLFGFLSDYRSQVVIYHCTSEYPCNFDNLFLKEVANIADAGFECGFSNHGYGIASDIAALALGASWIERHFIDDRSFPHTDAAASLEPHGFKTLKRDIDHVLKGLSYRSTDPTLEELRQRKKLRGS